MSNQASEDELVFIVNEYRDINRNEFTQVTAKCKCGRGGWVRLDKHPAIQSIIRTEKLKLLAEVRERVVGEDESPESIPPTMSAEYHNYVHAQNKLRDEQRYSLTKLEAEL